MTLIRHTLYMTLRHLRELWRQPWFVAVTLVQPVIWLLLFGALFKRVIEIPGFHAHSYIAFLAPGVVVMTAMFNSAWSGMALIDDLNRGVTARFLVSPVRREALIAGRILKEAVVVVIQSLIFLSTTFLAANLIPKWMRSVSDVNPVNWAVEAGRSATSANPDWGLVAARVGFLSALLVVCLAFATNAFRSYQRTV